MSAASVPELLKGYSIEVLARDHGAPAACSGSVPAGSEVFIAFVPGEAYPRLVEAAAALRKAGFVPVPHVISRSLPSAAVLDDLIARLAGEAGVDRILALGGDLDTPTGPFASVSDVLRTGLLENRGIRTVHFAVHPEGHPRVDEATLHRELGIKLGLARDRGLQTALVSQFSFEAGPILALLKRLDDDGVTAPMRIGIAGPASHKTLIRFAMLCGVKNSMRALTSRGTTVAQIGKETPDRLLGDLVAAGLPDRVTGLHLFPFGGTVETAKWANAAARG